MLVLLISFLSFLALLFKSLSLQPLPLWANEMRLLSLLFCQEFVYFFLHWLKDGRRVAADTARVLSAMSARKKIVPLVENAQEMAQMSVLDLPELALECILGRLSPPGLCNMAAVCSSLRERCGSDYLWQRHMKEKWGRLIGHAAQREWQAFVSSRKDHSVYVGAAGETKGWVGPLSCLWPVSWLRSKLDTGIKTRSPSPVNSMMSWYLALESGKFWFPAQVYNRENGHIGFMLSCYDAQLSYDCRTDTFTARYPPHGRRSTVIEEGVQWDRLREPPVDTPAHDLHVSDCLNDLRAGDHIEIQWRRNKEFPYGWWYGVVGHLDSCGGNEYHCRCQRSDTVILEFNQYTVGSRWRQTIINRKDHREQGNETDGFYGGVRKLQSKEEITTWKRLWPTEALD
uniref:F-box protein At2g32560 n=1 Tax=Anthurium amnicola TaxID=1678845 RepID=A0A1D1YXQ1_9ARAE